MAGLCQSLSPYPFQFRWVAKKELFRIPIFGAAMRRAGYIEIDRQHHEKAPHDPPKNFISYYNVFHAIFGLTESINSFRKTTSFC